MIWSDEHDAQRYPDCVLDECNFTGCSAVVLRATPYFFRRDFVPGDRPAVCKRRLARSVECLLEPFILVGHCGVPRVVRACALLGGFGIARGELCRIPGELLDL